MGALQGAEVPLALINGPADPISGRHAAEGCAHPPHVSNLSVRHACLPAVLVSVLWSRIPCLTLYHSKVS